MNVMIKNMLLIYLLISISSLLSAQDKLIDLSGDWQFEIDRQNNGEQEKWYNRKLSDQITLPGSMAEQLKGDRPNVHTQWTASLYDSSFFFNPAMAKYRTDENFKVPFFLTPQRYYVGAAWYKKEVDIPENWKDDRAVLFFERPHTETTVWINGREVGMQNSLSVGHCYDVTSFVVSGKNTIAVRVDNRIKDINVGMDSHSITDHTQGNWNGIVGEISLRATPKLYWDDIQVYPDLKHKTAKVKMRIKSRHSLDDLVKIRLAATSFNSPQQHTLKPIVQQFSISQGILSCEMELSFGDQMLTWDEFDPALYRLTAELDSKYGKETREVEFGMREFTIRGKWFYVNGVKTLLRGTLDCAAFPLTGYPPTDVTAWERIFQIYRNHGLNHVRFHSWCPPAAAFKAADRVGLYLQVEGPSWPNHGPKLGNGEPIDNYLMEETQRLTKAYGNYASYCMLAAGNEPAGRWVAWVSNFVDYWKKTDTRRVYTGASVGNGWQWQPHNQYHVKAGARGLDWDKRQPESLSDYRDRIDTVGQPYVSHESGQWCVFPNFDEIKKYTGVNRAGNFEIFRDILEKNHLEHKAHDFMMASGKLQALCYKQEIEKHLRTPDYAGFQLLGLTDFPGQGSAIIGLLDVFGDQRDYISAAQVRRFCNPTVLLARMPKYTFTNAETLEVTIEAAHFYKQPLQQAKTTYVIKDDLGNMLDEGVVAVRDIPVGNGFTLGKISFPLSSIKEAKKLNLEVRLEGTDVVNDWNFWVYPAEVALEEGDVYITDSLDERAIGRLQQGGKVLLTAAGKIKYGEGIVQRLSPVFWNTSWFQMKPPHTTGILVNDQHPLFRHFPTDYHSDLQWWELLNNAQVMLLSDFEADFEPLVQNIDTWFLSRKIGSLFEANVLGGRLMISSMDITHDLDHRIVARQMRKAVLDYMNSDDFRPVGTVAVRKIHKLFTVSTPDVNMYTNDSPDELKPKNNN